MTPKKRTTTRARTQGAAQAESPIPENFFEKQLVGEQAPSRSTMEELYPLTMEVFARRPWERFADTDLIAVQDPVSGELCFCCIMGALGEVFCIQAFIGSDGAAAFRALSSGDPDAQSTFRAVARTVYAELVQRKELEPPDRGLLTAMKHPARPGSRAPVFRSLRPGYLPWYVTDPEAKLLTHCLRAVRVFLDRMDAQPGERHWDKEDWYPLVHLDGENSGELGRVKMPAASTVLEMPNLDEQRVLKIKGGHYPVKGILEVDHFYGLGGIGLPHERKASMGLALVINAKTAFAFPPQVGAPDRPIADLIVDVLMGAIEISACIPAEVHVRSRCRRAVEGLGRKLGFRVRAMEWLPALDFCKQELLEMMMARGR